MLRSSARWTVIRSRAKPPPGAGAAGRRHHGVRAKILNPCPLAVDRAGSVVRFRGMARQRPIGPPAPGPLHIIGGGANGGCIAGAVSLPQQGEWYQTIHGRISHFWGAPVTILGVETLAREAHANGLPPLLIEDISAHAAAPCPAATSGTWSAWTSTWRWICTRAAICPRNRQSDPDRQPRATDMRGIEPSMWGRRRYAVVAGGHSARRGPRAGERRHQAAVVPDGHGRSRVAAFRAAVVRSLGAHAYRVQMSRRPT